MGKWIDHKFNPAEDEPCKRFDKRCLVLVFEIMGQKVIALVRAHQENTWGYN